MRDHLHAAGVEFDDRNVRQSESGLSELRSRTGDVVVPQLFYGDRSVTGFDPSAIDELIAAYRSGT